MKNKILIFCMIGFMLITIGIVSASDCDGTFLGTFKQGDNVNLKQVCDSCTYVTLSSVSYPNSNILEINGNMTKVGIDYNYTFENTDAIGSYGYSVFGDKDGTLATENFCFDITPSGFINTLGFYIVLLIVLGGILLIGFSIGEEWFVILGGMGFIMLGIYSINYGVAGFRDMFMTWGVGLFEIAVGAILAIGAGIQKMDYD